MSSTKDSPDTTPGEDSGAHHKTPQGLAARAHSLLSRWNGVHLIASMFVGGAVILYLLASKGAPSSALAQQEAGRESDAVLAQMSSDAAKRAADNRAEVVGKTLQGQASDCQVPVSQIGGNPFIFERMTQAQTQGVASASQLPEPADPQAEELAAMVSKAEKLQLESTLFGSQEQTAMISGRVLKQGQEIDGWVLTKILPKKVVLTWNGQVYTLMMR